MATSIHSMVTIFEFSSRESSKKKDPFQLSIFTDIQASGPSDAALMMSAMQGLLWQLNNPSLKGKVLLPISTLLFDAMQRLVPVRLNQNPNPNPHLNEHLLCCFVSILHLIEELHVINLSSATGFKDLNVKSQMMEKIHSISIGQLDNALMWLVTRDSFHKCDNPQSETDVFFGLQQVGFKISIIAAAKVLFTFFFFTTGFDSVEQTRTSDSKL